MPPLLTGLQKLERHIFYSPDGCWYWTGKLDGVGYGLVRNEHSVMIGAHRMSYLVHKGPIPKGHHVCHTCDNPLCVNPDHLWAGTTQQNTEDKVKKNRQSKGSENGMAKLTFDQITEIKRLWSEGGNQHKIAKLFNVQQSAISRIVNGIRWKHLHDENATPRI